MSADTDSGQSSLPPDSPRYIKSPYYLCVFLILAYESIYLIHSSFDVKELHHQKSRLQEEVKLLQDQMIDLEENNAQLKKDNILLKTKLQK